MASKKDCITCKHAGKDCIPYIMTLSPAELNHWCRSRKKALHLSADDIARKTKVPKSTIERIFAKDTDCRFSTLQPVVQLLSGCSPDDLDCQHEPAIMEAAEKIAHQEEMIHRLEDENKRLFDDHLSTDEQNSRNQDFMQAQIRWKNRVIIVLGVCLAVSVILIASAVIIDRADPELGYIWRETPETAMSEDIAAQPGDKKE